MSDNRKYYYLKLKENYFDEDAIVLLESMQDGILYSNILLKLYLKSLKNGGKLQLDENIPYTAQMIATITRQQVGTVERALQIFMKLGLVEPLQNGALYMSNIELLIGQSSTEGERKRRARLALQEQKALPKAGADKCPPYQADICPPEIEIEKEIEKEKESDREMEIGERGEEGIPKGSGGERTSQPPGEAGELFRQWLEAMDSGRRLDAADLSNRLFRMGYEADIQSRSWRERKNG